MKPASYPTADRLPRLITCACGCGRQFETHGRGKWASRACRMRAYRRARGLHAGRRGRPRKSEQTRTETDS